MLQEIVYSVIMIAVTLLSGCSKEDSIKFDFSTPEGAILCLENAYNSKDIEACVKCKDFRTEARLMIENTNKLKNNIDDELIIKTAEVLELAYRKELEQKGFPDMKGVKSTFPKKDSYKDNIVIVTEVCHYLDKGTSKQRILVCKTAEGWRVLNPVE